MSTSDDRPYDQESAGQGSAGERAGRSAEDDTGVERHPPSSANELWDHNAYGREDGNVGGRATTGVTDTRDPRGGAPAYNIDAGDDDAFRHGDEADPDAEDGSNVRAPGESLTGPDATAGHGRESVADGPRDTGPGSRERTVDQEAAGSGAAGGTDRGRHVAREGDAGGLPNGADGRGGEPPPGRGVTGVDRSAAAQDRRVAEGDAGTSVVRHEERLRVGTEQTVARRVRLRKYVVQEPVRHEQTLVSEDVEEIRTPVTEEEREAFLDGRELPVGEDEVILYREVPVVQTVRVPYERVRLAVRRTERAEVVEDTIRKEQVDIEEN